jgi:hypothetical protein
VLIEQLVDVAKLRPVDVPVVERFVLVSGASWSATWR